MSRHREAGAGHTLTAENASPPNSPGTGRLVLRTWRKTPLDRRNLARSESYEPNFSLGSVNFIRSYRKNGKCCENLINISNVDQSVLIFLSKFQRDTTRTDNFIRLKSNKRFTICSQKQQPLVRSNDAIFDREHVLRKLSRAVFVVLNDVGSLLKLILHAAWQNY